jgi:hypothetical protein
MGQLSFADAYPVLVISRASLEDLNRRLPAPLRMNRFRPNLVVEGCAPFEEDRWRRIRVGEAILRLVKPCDRCATTTVEQETAAVGREPLRTLATFRRWDRGGVIFGQNAVVEVAGPVRVGDAVEVLERGEPPVLEPVAPHPASGGSPRIAQPSAGPPRRETGLALGLKKVATPGGIPAAGARGCSRQRAICRGAPA